jgi:hypothetical protein
MKKKAIDYLSSSHYQAIVERTARAVNARLKMRVGESSCIVAGNGVKSCRLNWGKYAKSEFGWVSALWKHGENL